MDLRPGYKQTEVGVVPEDWRLRPLSEVVTFLDGKRRPVKDSDRSKMQGSIPYYGASGIVDYVNGYLFDEELILLGEDGENILSRNCRLAFRISGKAWVNNHAHVLKPNTDMSIGFLADFLESLNYEQYNSGTAQPKLNKQACSGILIALPPTKTEQEVIAEALSDADALIESLEQLLSKKRQIKQGAMQELLTGKKRLSGFSGEWDLVSIGEIASVKTGPFGSSLHESDYVQDGTPIITVEHLGEFGVTCQNLPLVSDNDCKRLCSYALEVGDIVFSRVGSVDRNALISKGEEGWLFSGRLLRVRADKKYVHAPYLSFQFHTQGFKNLVLAVAVGQTMASLNTKILRDIFVSLPSIQEQVAIANILRDMDADISALEAKLSKARAIKQGMMQQLLTGTIRLIERKPLSAERGI